MRQDGASNTLKITFVGFGEAAQAFTTGLVQETNPVTVQAFDIKTDGPDAAQMQSRYNELGVIGKSTNAEACAGSDVIFSLVTAEQAESAAQAAAQTDLNGALFFDCNSCAPNTKRRSAKLIEAAGGRYVDVAVMTPVHPKLHKSPCLLAGPHAQAALEATSLAGMTTTIAGDNVGDASTRKMIRSVMIKGLEALTLECFLAARQAGLETDIQASLELSFPGFEWERRAPYMMERMATHGIRRAAEMREVVKTLHDLGISSHMTDGTVQRQSEVGALGLKISDSDSKDLAVLTDTLLAGLTATAPSPNTKE